MTFKEWWAEQPSIDYDEMVVAKAAWDYQQTQLTAANARVEELEKRYAVLQHNITPYHLSAMLDIDLGDIPEEVSIADRIDELVDAALLELEKDDE